MPRGIDDLLSTSSDIVGCFLFFVAFDTDCLSVDRLHVNRHVVLFKRVVELNGGLLTYLIGKHEDVVVLEFERCSRRTRNFYWTDELLDSATHPGKHPGKRTEKEKGPGS